MPYDEFIVEQLAADRLPIAEQDKTRLAALGFLTTGRKFNNRNDDIDDQIDVVSRGLLGVTVACARCHDHKYDAIPTEDYYSLYGVFANCTEPAELPLIAEPQTTAEYQKFETELNKLKAEVDRFVSEKHKEFLDQTRRQSADYLARVAAGRRDTIAARLPFMSLDPKDLRPRLLESLAAISRRHGEARTSGSWPVARFAEGAHRLVCGEITAGAGCVVGKDHGNCDRGSAIRSCRPRFPPKRRRRGWMCRESMASCSPVFMSNGLMPGLTETL